MAGLLRLQESLYPNHDKRQAEFTNDNDKGLKTVFVGLTVPKKRSNHTKTQSLKE